MAFDLNSDLGEGFGAYSMGDDAAMLDIVTSANIACGFHAGDPSIMRRTCELAVAKGVRIGAHIGYRDLVGFGRRHVAVTADELRDETLYQVGSLDVFARSAGDRVRYVKPHGALYHAAAADRELAEAVLSAMAEFGGELSLLGPAGTELEAAARARGIAFVGEGFADRAYLSSGRLAPRSQPGAVLWPDDAVTQALSIARDSKAVTVDGGAVAVRATSICVHGDSPAAVEMARRIRSTLDDAGIPVGAFC
ncbi:LamB/YcsF family protein [Nocardia otitidiscaviarum]|uniref:5-oxoprolinase subunit A n=1 Tax=Nocardia otitidiscaviarum TaxID=1823 RepID=A0A516NUM9_9NOCA|nr:5-oxoprolinase subunit PxpA [Nocardia otitidiscaviarum]MBF6178723.1 LamB/YcsF family protein [Nocardia otitidiscaviarum]MCP9622008.1 LamB/YcsF family protein [Nocardia otitidiscaviarum]QDP82603.1 LamB/YcsF family protein [Nocardia otitidiscaviarum]